MIRFYRNIRQKLVNQGRLKKYLLYAMGEILLVMIGILLAVQVNKWNENRKLAFKAESYMKHILSDLKTESSIFQERLELHVRQEGQFKESIDMLYETQKNHSDAVVFFNKLANMQQDDLVPVDATYQEIINSGDLSIFKNDSLVNQIMKYYTQNYDAAAQIKEFNGALALERTMIKANNNMFHLKYLLGYHRYPQMFDDEEWSYLNDSHSPQFKAAENIAVLSIFKEMDHGNRMKELIEKNEELQARITSELRTR